MSSPRAPLTLALLLLSGFAGLQTLPMTKVDVESDPKTDFSTFKTFRWKDSQVPAENPIVHTSVAVYVERGLTSKGLTRKMEGEADLWVRYYTAKDEKATSGRLVLELYRTSDAVLVWKGSVMAPSIDKNRPDTEVKSAVRRLMAKYPPPSS